MKMNKLKSTISYGCLTKIRPLVIFYLVEYGFFALIMTIVVLCTGKLEANSNGPEAASAVFVSIMGALSFKEDFKAFLQNGFTRRYIFLSTFCSFFLVSAAMALVDTLLGNVLHHFMKHFTIFGTLYGYGNLLTNWLWLTFVYVMFCSIFYLAALVINKVGKTTSLLIGVGLAGAVLLIAALFRFVFSSELVSRIGRLVLNAFGFMNDGTVNLVFPILTFIVIGAVFGLGSYALIRLSGKTPADHRENRVWNRWDNGRCGWR